jgi:hypothetical protein
VPPVDDVLNDLPELGQLYHLVLAVLLYGLNRNLGECGLVIPVHQRHADTQLRGDLAEPHPLVTQLDDADTAALNS